MIVIGIDPGKTVGVAIHGTGWTVKPSTDQVPCEQFGLWLETVLFNGIGGPDTDGVLISCERFVITARTVRTAADANWPIEMIGVARFLAAKYGAQFFLQAVSDAGDFAPDARLRDVGWYVPGRDHANDAIRQVVLAKAKYLKIAPPWT